MLLSFFNQSFLYNGLFLGIIYLFFTPYFDEATAVVLCLFLMVLILGLTALFIKKTMKEYNPLLNLTFLVIKFLGAGTLFIVLYLLKYHTQSFALLFTSNYFLHTVIFSVFLSKIKADKPADTQQ